MSTSVLGKRLEALESRRSLVLLVLRAGENPQDCLERHGLPRSLGARHGKDVVFVITGLPEAEEAHV